MTYCIKNTDGTFSAIKSNSNIGLSSIEEDMVYYAKRKFSEIKSRVKTKGFEPEKISINEFLNWIMNGNNYESIYINYINSKKSRSLAPSIDRLDDYKTYSLDNIRLTIWKENKDKYNSDRLIGKNTKQSKPITSIDEKGEKTYYHSTHFASQKTGISRSSICRSARTNSISILNNKKLSRSGKYIWIFNHDLVNY